MKREYSSAQVATQTGATLRELQWWDEKEIIVAKRGRMGTRHDARIYTEAQVREVERIVNLRQQCRFNMCSERGRRIIQHKGPVVFVRVMMDLNGTLVVPLGK